MSKLVLTFDDEYDFDLIGISCHSKDYRLCWEINKNLKLDLIRKENLEIKTKTGNGNYSLYEFNDNENHLDYFLISNKCDKGFLIPEQKSIDFLLMLKGYTDDSHTNDTLTKINNLSLVLTSFLIDPTQLKSKENLLF